MNRLLLSLLLLVSTGHAVAQEAPLGRLFLTPEQRALLDNARRNKIRAAAVAGAIVKKPKPPAARSVLINGIVKRSDGETIVWVNGKPTDGETPDGMQFQTRADGGVTVRDPEHGRRVEIKVGQQVDMLTGRIKEPFERPPQSVAPAPKSAPAQRAFVSKRPRTSPSDRDRSPDEPTQEPPAPPPEKPPQ